MYKNYVINNKFFCAGLQANTNIFKSHQNYTIDTCKTEGMKQCSATTIVMISRIHKVKGQGHNISEMIFAAMLSIFLINYCHFIKHFI